VAHATRPELKARHPVHVVLRTHPEIGSLRRGMMYHAVRRATVRVAKREDFRIVHMSIQRTHVHLLVEADGKRALSRGMQGFLISAAKQINAAMSGGVHVARRRGTVFIDRYHATIITSPRQARHALKYVMLNWRKHGEDREALAGGKIDVFSSAARFESWAECGALPASDDQLRVTPPKTWLLQQGWKLHGATISCFEVPSAM
jgi:REP element-mobilizing transposase RayT